MLFNPLFVDISPGSGIEGQLKASRFSDPEYLFADIIKISSDEIQMTDLPPISLSEQSALQLTTDSNIDEQEILNLLSGLQEENNKEINAEKVEDLLNLFPELILSESGSAIDSGKIISLVENGFPVELNIQTKNNEEIKLIFSSAEELHVKNLHPGKPPISSDLQPNIVKNYLPNSGEELKNVSSNQADESNIFIDPKNKIDAFTVLSNQKEIENVKNVLNSFKTGGEPEPIELNKAGSSFINQKEFLNNKKLQTGEFKSTKIFAPEIQVDEKANKLNDLFANKNIEAATKIKNEVQNEKQNSPAVEVHSNKLPKNNYENLVDKTFKFIENASKLNIDAPVKVTEHIDIKTEAEAVKIQNVIQNQKIDASSVEMKKTEELFKDFSEKTFKIYVNASKENITDTPLKIIPLKEFNLRAESAKPFEVIHQENAISNKPSENFNNQNFNQEFSNKNSANPETGLKQPDTISLSNPEEKSFKSEIVNNQKENVSENNAKEAGQTAGVDISKDQIKSFTQLDSIQASIDSKSLPKINHPVELTKLVEEIKSVIEKGEIKTFELKLTPENLGSVKVIITSTEQIVKASIEVENETVLQAVQTNIDQLKLSLAQSGIQVAAVNVSLAGNDNKANKSSDSKRKLSEGGSELAVEEKNDERLFKKYGYNTYEYLA